MTPQGFSFPPPPPPPPQNQPQSTYPPVSQYGQNYGQRGGRGGYQRGRGRGYGNRGGGRGGHFSSSDAAHPHPYSSNAPPSVNYGQVNYAGYAAQPLPTHTPGNIPASQYGQTASQYAQPQPAGYHAPNPTAFTSQPFSQHMPQSPYQRQTGYETAYNQSTNMQHPTTSYPTQTTAAYPTMPTHQHTPFMAPPMRWGFENPGNMGSYSGNQHGHARGPRSFNSYGPNKRDHASAFGKPRAAGPRTPAPPPVPSFGNPLPSKPPPPADAARKSKKKKRKHNQLGLTPKAEEHESSEEEDDLDEESKLVARDSGPSMGLQFTYRGKTSTLQSAADIAAWIEERKKRFPTQARVEEKKKAMEEAKKVREEAAKQKEIQRQEFRRQQKEAREKERGKQDHKEPQEKPADPADTAAKAKQKADKLRRKLMKEEKRVAKAEADAERARLTAEALQNGATHEATSNLNANEQHAVSPHGLDTATKHTELETTPGEPSLPTDSMATPLPSEDQANSLNLNADETLALSSSASENSDWTSSSGSDIDSEDSDDGSAPEEMTSRREGPERVPPPARETKKRICRHFARSGRCLRGERCMFLHEMPERGPKAKTQRAEKTGRKGLLQALLDRQKDDEDRRVMEAIMVLGEKGVLEEPTTAKEE